jgi:hypothetical protein
MSLLRVYMGIHGQLSFARAIVVKRCEGDTIIQGRGDATVMMTAWEVTDERVMTFELIALIEALLAKHIIVEG